MHSISKSVHLVTKIFQSYKDAFPQMPKREVFSPGFSILLTHAVWMAFFDRCLMKLPIGEHLSPQYGGAWALESSSLAHFPTTSIALNRMVRDGQSHASGLILFPEEWLVVRDWYIVDHWEDQFCRDT